MSPVIDQPTLDPRPPRGARPWSPRDSAVSRLGARDRQRLVLTEPPARPESPRTTLPPVPRTLRTRVDWRDVDGRCFVTPPRSQVGGTCVAFANTAAVESSILKAQRGVGDGIDLAERVLAECNPGYPASVADYLQTTGLPPEACFRYDGTTAPVAGWEDAAFRVVEHDYYRFLPIDAYKAVLAADGPLVSGMNVGNDFFSYGDGVYTTTVRADVGFHEVLVVGYDDSQGCFIAKNSWGADWGEGGFFRIAYRHFEDDLVGFGSLTDAFRGVVPPRRRSFCVPVALRTLDGHTLTMVDGGGLGGPNTGRGATALHTDALTPGPWETFTVEWLDDGHLALRTDTGTYLTAVDGGGVGGPNDATSPVHTDATWTGPWERLTLTYDAATGTATIQTNAGRYLTAVNGGGFGGTARVPIHTDARAIGPWETFTATVTP